MEKYIKFNKNIYNDFFGEKSDCIRVVFFKDYLYKIKFENEDVYMIQMPNNSYYFNNNFGIEKGLENSTYEIIIK